MSKKRTSNLIRAVLVTHFPLCFNPPKTPKKPLKIGIFDDILNYFPELKPDDLQAALGSYAGGPTYQLMMVEGAIRVDLNGNAAGIVTAEEAAHAIEILEKYKPKTSQFWQGTRFAEAVLL